MMMPKVTFLLFILGVLSYRQVDAVDCLSAVTSEGIVHLTDGQKACAPLQDGESDTDKGKRFITCVGGYIFTQECPPGLRHDTKTGGCSWPSVSTCTLTSGTVAPTQAPATTPRIPPCDSSSNCHLPHCFCYGDVPRNVNQSDLPMFIMLTFDDGITASFYDSFFSYLVINNSYQITNPSGCNIKVAYYVIDDNTDYSKLKILADAGHEIASHTMHHTLAQGDKDSDYQNISAEIVGMRNKVFEKTGDQKLANSLVGFRAPYLRVAGNIMFDVLHDNRFLYDTSIVNTRTYAGKQPIWPFTLDFPVTECVNPPCPTKLYPGLWEVPLNAWIGDDGYSCSMIDACSVGENIFDAKDEDWYAYYQRNFQDHFYTHKIPMHMFTHASLFLRSPNSFPALARWLFDITHRPEKDVWLVTPTQVIQWMHNQLTNTQMKNTKWGC